MIRLKADSAPPHQESRNMVTKRGRMTGKLSLAASVGALALVMAAPAQSQQPRTTPAPAQQPVATPATGAQTGQRLDREQITEKLERVGISEREPFRGQLVRTQSPEGHPVLMVIGPENFAGDESVNVDQDRIRGALTTSGFSNIQFIRDAEMVRGQFEGNAVLAMVAQPGWRGTAGPAQANSPDRERLSEQLGKAGLESRQELRGRLLRAQVNGRTLFLAFGPEDFAGDETIDLSATHMTRFQQNGLEQAQVVRDIQMIRGQMNDRAVLVLSGGGIAG